MAPNHLRILKIAEWIFLIGVALLIVRNNVYPWPLKRASDILFLCSTLVLGWFLIATRSREFLTPFFRKACAGIGTILLGLAVASTAGFFANGTAVNAEGVLAAARFIEAGILLLLVGIFLHVDADFYKKIAVAQLSTLVYLGILIVPERFSVDMHRFQLFENWPSNVGYYLIVSMGFVIAWLLYSARNLPKHASALCLGGTGFFSILWWTGTRAAWLGVLAGLLLLLFTTLREKGTSSKQVLLQTLLIASMASLGFLILSPSIKDFIVSRTLAEPQGEHDIAVFAKDKLPPGLRDERRLYLWDVYSKKLFRSPLGLGLNYEPIRDEGGYPQGPHNTPLEVLVMAGPVGLAGFFYLLFLATKNLHGKLTKSVGTERIWYGYLGAALAGLLIASLFDDMSTFRLMWIVLGMAVFAGTPSSDQRVLTQAI